MCVCACVCVCECVCVLGAGIVGRGLGEVEAWLGNTIMKLFSFLYIAASGMAHVH